jgi:uncharacterized repeat protein (TIGR03943 family)
MRTIVQRYVPAGVLVVWGTVLAYFYFSGRVGNYLHPSFHLWTGLSGIALVIMAGGMLFLPGAERSEEDRKIPLGRVIGALILIVPLLVASTVSPSQFGAALVQNRGLVDSLGDLPGFKPYVDPALPTADGTVEAGQPADPASYLPRNDAGQIKAQTVDLLYAAEEPTMRQDFEGKEVELIGQFMPAKTNNPQGDRFNLVRMFVMCCAADARPVAVTVKTSKPENVPEMSWVKVTGKATFPLEGGRRIPVVVADSVSPSDPPEESFIY